MKFLNNIQYSPDGDGGGDAIQFTPEQEEVIKQRISAELENHKPDITLKSAQDFLKNANIKVFSSEGDYHQDITNTLNRIVTERIEHPNALEKSVLKFKSGLAGEVLSPVDQEIKVLTGKEKLEGEKTRDYIKRVIPELIKGGDIDAAEFNSTKSKLNQAQTKIKEWEQKYVDLQNTTITNEKNQLISKGIPTNLDYSLEEMNIMLPGINSRINEKYDIQKDDKGFIVIDRAIGEAVLDGEGRRKDVSIVVNDYVKSMSDLRFKKEDGSNNNGGANLPGDNGANNPLNDEQMKDKSEQWVNQLAEKGLVGHEKEAFVMRKQLGLPLTQQALDKWPELKN